MKTEEFYKLYLEDAFAPTVPSVREFCAQLVKVTRSAFNARLATFWWNNDPGRSLTFEASDPKKPSLFAQQTIPASSSLTGLAIQTVDIAFTPSIAKAAGRSPANPEVHTVLGLESLLSIPVPNSHNYQEIIGVLNVSFGDDVTFRLDEHRESLAWLQFMCSQFIEILVLATRHRITAQVTALATNAKSYDDLLRRALPEALRHVNASGLTLYSIQPDGGIQVDCTLKGKSGLKTGRRRRNTRGANDLIERALREGTAVLGQADHSGQKNNSSGRSQGFQRIVCPLPAGTWAEPVLSPHQMRGFIELYREPSSNSSSFSKLDMDAVQAFCQALGPAIRAYKSQAAARARREALVGFMNRVTSCLTEKEVFTEAAKAIKTSGFHRAMLSSLSADESVILGVAVTSTELRGLQKATLRKYPGPDVLPQVLERMKERFVPDSRQESGLCDPALVGRFGITSQHVYPIHVHTDRIGTLQVFPTDYRKLDDQEELVLQAVCQLTAVTISRLRYAAKATSGADTSEQELRLDNINVTCHAILHDTLKQLKQVSEGLDNLASSLPPQISFDLEKRQGEIKLHQDNIRTLATVHATSVRKAGASESRRAHNLFSTIDRWRQTVGDNRAAIGGCSVSVVALDTDLKTTLPSHTLNLVLDHCLHNALQVNASYFTIVIGNKRPELVQAPASDCLCVSITNDIRKSQTAQRKFNLGLGTETCRRVLDRRGGGFDIVIGTKQATAYLLIPMKAGTISQ